MAIIYMTHPVHGAKVATMEQEAVFDESNGWVRYTLETQSVVENAAPEQEVKKRGRKATKTEQPAADEVPEFLAPQADQGE